MYGETSPSHARPDSAAGLSPHVRGNQERCQRLRCSAGSIPACTGKPRVLVAKVDAAEVYPRMYGETTRPASGDWEVGGLSPHVRGNQGQPGPHALVAGSIPACTGKPRALRTRAEPQTVYPRMYGETEPGCVREGEVGGLSPHVRGNLTALRLLETHNRSIPACTGKPFQTGDLATWSKVYPRMYGETQGAPAEQPARAGLSPHVRGNRLTMRILPACKGSIPACTGKPDTAVPPASPAAVYPRMYGETTNRVLPFRYGDGLSPHVRGNPTALRAAHPQAGSIPACTGKPDANQQIPDGGRVYPRMYGETTEEPGDGGDVGGLSPHVRGNRRSEGLRDLRRGSIPACTGKPSRNPSCRTPLRVYPRMYGETRWRRANKAVRHGLSPHVRGNPPGPGLGPGLRWSIPACTGKPRVAARARC